MASTSGLQRKLGPLPVWAWGLIFGVGGYFFYRYYKSGSSSTPQASPTGTVLDPNAIDPNTGLTYGQEESAALNANATSPSAGGLAGSNGSGTGSLSGAGSLSDQLTNLQTIFGLIQQLDPNLGAPPAPPNPSDTTTTATQSPPIINISLPPTTPTTHHPLPSPVLTPSQIAKQLLTSAGLGGQAATSFIASLVQQGYTHGKGAAAGTYTKKGSKHKYFVFQLGGQTHVREALPAKGK